MRLNITKNNNNMTFTTDDLRAEILIDGLEPCIDDDGKIWESGEIYFDAELYDNSGDLIDSDSFTATNEVNRIAEAKNKAILWVMNHLI